MFALRRFASTSTLSLNFVPKHEPPTKSDIGNLQSFVSENSKILVLTGAGVSTESGIPDYRSEGVGLYSKPNYRPSVKIQEFLSSSTSRRIYWARNFFGWSRFASLKPNVAHLTIRKWQLGGKVKCLVTQNVDGLHKKAGSNDSIELHGTGHLVVCIKCTYKVSREIFQNVLIDLNSNLCQSTGIKDIRPDGDIELDLEIAEKFVIPPCPSCGSALKPDIVFFGDNVPKLRVQQIYDFLDKSDGLLVLGSSLQTFSAFRYILTAKERGIPTAIVNLGPTRADDLVNLKLICRVGEILPLVQL